MHIPLAAAETLNASDATTPKPYPTRPSIASVDAVNDRRWGRLPRALRGAVARAQQWVRSLGPYVAIELLLPGGTIIALVLWALRQRRAARDEAKPSPTEAAPAEPHARLRCTTLCP
jgi:hypothetical protein